MTTCRAQGRTPGFHGARAARGRSAAAIRLPAAWLVLLGLTACSSQIVTGHDHERAADAATEARPHLDDGDGPAAADAGQDQEPAADGGAADSTPAATPTDGAASDAAVAPCLSGSPPRLLDVSATELHEELATKDFLLINVAGAPSIPETDAVLSYSDTDQLVAFIGADTMTRVVLYCQSGGRSSVAGNALVARGYCSIRQLAGGKSAWSAAGYPLE